MLHANLILPEHISIEAWYACRWHEYPFWMDTLPFPSFSPLPCTKHRVGKGDQNLANSSLLKPMATSWPKKRETPGPVSKTTVKFCVGWPTCQKNQDHTMESTPSVYQLHGNVRSAANVPGSRKCLSSAKDHHDSSSPECIRRSFVHQMRQNAPLLVNWQDVKTGESSPLLNHCPQSSFHSRPSCVTLCGHLPSRVKMQKHQKTCAISELFMHPLG